MSESGSRFLKQSLWMIAATLGGGAGMALVHGSVSKLGGPQVYFQFKSLMAIFYVVGAAQGALWTMTARQTAMALSREAIDETRGRLKRSAGTVLLMMSLVGLALIPGGPALSQHLKLSSV